MTVTLMLLAIIPIPPLVTIVHVMQGLMEMDSIAVVSGSFLVKPQHVSTTFISTHTVPVQIEYTT